MQLSLTYGSSCGLILIHARKIHTTVTLDLEISSDFVTAPSLLCPGGGVVGQGGSIERFTIN